MDGRPLVLPRVARPDGVDVGTVLVHEQDIEVGGVWLVNADPNSHIWTAGRVPTRRQSEFSCGQGSVLHGFPSDARNAGKVLISTPMLEAASSVAEEKPSQSWLVQTSASISTSR